MAKTFHLTVAHVGENIFDGEAVSLVVPAEDGVMTVLANHEPYVTTLKIGTLFIETESGEKQQVALDHAGLLEISSNQATVLL
jgi:F-type H+-transporting ATPase subunit epsilon